MKILGTLGNVLRKLLTNFEKVLEYIKSLIDQKSFKETRWKFRKNI